MLQDAGLLIAIASGILGGLIVGVIGLFSMRKKRLWLKKRLAEGHEWIAVPPGGPLEEGGMCKHCGAWATSEERTPCYPQD